MEEYQVKRIESEYQEDLNRAKEQHDKMIKLIKENCMINYNNKSNI